MAPAIDSIDWARLRQATGTCEGIPEALRALLSADEKTREEAYWSIDNHVILQGDLYEGAPYVAKALVELLPSASAGRDRIYDLLVELANGNAPENQQVVVEGRSRSIKRATMDHLITGLDTYRMDLKAPATGIRQRAAELLLALSKDVKVDAHELRGLVGREPDKTVRSLIEELLGETKFF